MRFRQIITTEEADATSTTSGDIASVAYPLFVAGRTRRARRKNARRAVGQPADSAPSYIGRGVYESNLKEFAPVGRGPWGSDDGDADPYRYPKPESYRRSIDFFGRFEADHFDREDMNDATGEFKGYWGSKQIAYFKFDNPQKTGSDDPGMGWYYEPETDDNNDTSADPAVDNSAQRKQQELGMIDAFLKSGQKAKPGSQIHSLMKRHGMAEGVDIGQEWMSDTELDQYVPERLQQQWRELLGYDENGNPSALWANLTGGYEPDVNDPQHRALMVKVANKWFSAKKIPNVKFFDVKDADDELEWLVQIGQQGVAEAHTLNSDSVIYRLDREDPMNASEVLVLGGAGRYSLAGLRDKARREARALAADLEGNHGGGFRGAAHNIKQLTNTLNTIVAAYNELKRIRSRGGRGSRGITDEDANFIRECFKIAEQWTQRYVAENGRDPGQPIPFPPGTTKIDVSDTTDWYRLGLEISDLDDADPSEFNQGPPHTVITFANDEVEQPYLKQFKRLGFKVNDIDEPEDAERFSKQEKKS